MVRTFELKNGKRFGLEKISGQCYGVRKWSDKATTIEINGRFETSNADSNIEFWIKNESGNDAKFSFKDRDDIDVADGQRISIVYGTIYPNNPDSLKMLLLRNHSSDKDAILAPFEFGILLKSSNIQGTLFVLSVIVAGLSLYYGMWPMTLIAAGYIIYSYIAMSKRIDTAKPIFKQAIEQVLK